MRLFLAVLCVQFWLGLRGFSSEAAVNYAKILGLFLLCFSRMLLRLCCLSMLFGLKELMHRLLLLCRA